MNIEVAVYCVLQSTEFNRKINELYSLWCKEQKRESGYPLQYYLEWALSVGVVVPWLEWAIHRFPHLVSGKVFHHGIACREGYAI